MTIIHPQLSNKFRVITNVKDSEVLTLNITSCIIDYCNHRIHLVVDQPLDDNGLHRVIKQLCAALTNISIDHLNDAGEVTHAIIFENCRIVDHKYELSYNVSNVVAIHKILLAFPTKY